MIINFNKIKRTLFDYLPSLIKIGIIKDNPRLYSCFRYAPRFAALNITDNCCFKCVMCDQWKTHAENELNTNEWKGIFCQLKKIGIQSISFAGGEPFLRNDLVDLISDARRLGMDVAVTTNGFLLNEDNIKKAIDAGAKHFSISVDAVGRDFDNIRGIEGAYAKILNTCKILSSYKEKGMISVHLYFTLMKSTLAAYKDVFSLAETFGFPFVVNLFDCTPYFFAGLKTDKDKFWIGNSDSEVLNEFQEFIKGKKKINHNSVYHIYSEIDYFKKYFIDPLSKDIPCSVSQQRLGIDSQGNVYGGCWSMGKLGNLRSNPLAAIANSVEYKKRHRNMFFKECPGCSCGYTTNIRHSLSEMIKEAGLRLELIIKKKKYG